jgi:uncharacterized protein (DUF58 family)
MVATSAPERLLRRLDWQVLRRLDGQLQGDYRSLFRGAGLDLASLREYQPGDDVRAIDWNVTARMRVPYVREYHEDREVTAWFLLDLSPSLDFGTLEPGRTKRAVLIDLAVTLARVLTRRGNRVGAFVYDAAVEQALPARSGRIQVLRLADDLLGRPLLERAPETDLRLLLHQALRVVRRRCVVVVVSDFISQPGWEQPLAALSRRHDVLAVRLLDPRETDLPDVGPIVLRDAESGETLYVDTHDAGLRARFQAAARERESVVRTAFAQAGVEAMSLSTQDDLVRAIVRMAAARRRRRWRSAA